MTKAQSSSSEERRHKQRHYLGRRGQTPFVNESWEKDEQGNVVRYALAFIDFLIFPGDNGRVLGYGNAHDRHERHFMGKVDVVEFSTYEEQVLHFFAEVEKIRSDHG